MSMHGITDSTTRPVETVSPLLLLPVELRHRIYEYTATADLEIFADKTIKPGLLSTSKQLQKEYRPFFYDHASLNIEGIIRVDGEWEQFEDRDVRSRVFEQSFFTDMVDFWSVASARRYCRCLFWAEEGRLRTGVMSINTKGGIKRWQWTIEMT